MKTLFWFGQTISYLFTMKELAIRNVYVERVFVYWTFQNVSITTDLDWLEFEMFPLFMRPSSVMRSIKSFQDRADLYKKGIQV